MNELAPLIFDLAVMLGLAAIVMVLFRAIRQPVVLGYLVAGMIVGPYTPPYALVSDIPNIQTLSELGVIFLLFSLGLEFSFKKLMRVGAAASLIAVIEVSLMAVVGYGLGRYMGWPIDDSLFLGAALSISSTTIIIKAIDGLGLKTKRFAHLVYGILIVEDLLAILLLVALSTVMITGNAFSFDMAKAALKLIMVVGSWVMVGHFIVPPLFRYIGKYLNEEMLTVISVAFCLFLSCFAAKLHYSSALGAFIMGALLGETQLIERIVLLMRPIRDVFAAVFFISVGMLINPAVIIDHWHAVILIALVTVIGKIIITTGAAMLARRGLRASLRVGFSMAQVGEFSFIIAALGVALHVTDNTFYPLIVAVSGITTFTTPYLMRISGVLSRTLKRSTT
jgi:CPA2 family monovalent cation:H+ antiporter-2